MDTSTLQRSPKNNHKPQVINSVQTDTEPITVNVVEIVSKRRENQPNQLVWSLGFRLL